MVLFLCPAAACPRKLRSPQIAKNTASEPPPTKKNLAERRGIDVNEGAANDLRRHGRTAFQDREPRGEQSCLCRSRLGPGCFKSTDFGAEFLHRSLIRLALARGGVVTGTLVKQSQEADGIHRAEVISKNGDTLPVEVDGIGVIRGSAHGVSGGAELDGIHYGDGQVVGMPGCEAEKLVVCGENCIRFQAFGGGEVKRIEAFETESVQIDAPLLDCLRKGLG